jgi:hypothetical protein
VPAPWDVHSFPPVRVPPMMFSPVHERPLHEYGSIAVTSHRPESVGIPNKRLVVRYSSSRS